MAQVVEKVTEELIGSQGKNNIYSKKVLTIYYI